MLNQKRNFVFVKTSVAMSGHKQMCDLKIDFFNMTIIIFAHYFLVRKETTKKVNEKSALYKRKVLTRFFQSRADFQQSRTTQ